MSVQLSLETYVRDGVDAERLVPIAGFHSFG